VPPPQRGQRHRSAAWIQTDWGQWRWRRPATVARYQPPIHALNHKLMQVCEDVEVSREVSWSKARRCAGRRRELNRATKHLTCSFTKVQAVQPSSNLADECMKRCIKQAVCARNRQHDRSMSDLRDLQHLVHIHPPLCLPIMMVFLLICQHTVPKNEGTVI